MFHQDLAIENSGEILNVVDTIMSIAKDVQTPLYLGQGLLKFAHRYIGDIDLRHKHIVGFALVYFFHALRAAAVVFLSNLEMVFRMEEPASSSSTSVCKMVTPMCRADPIGSRRAVRILHTMFCAELSFPVLHKALAYLETVSSRRRYPNVYISSTNTGNLTRG